jgi:hypothetical protein
MSAFVVGGLITADRPPGWTRFLNGRGFDVKLHALPKNGDISCRPIAERRKTKASGLEREKGRGENRTRLGAESDPFRRSRKHRAASWGGSFICCTQILSAGILCRSLCRGGGGCCGFIL